MKTKLIALLLAGALVASGERLGYVGSEQWFVDRARMVLADPGRWSPEHVERARQILAQYQARQEAAWREAERRVAEQERAAEDYRRMETNRRLNDLEREAAIRENRPWVGR